MKQKFILIILAATCLFTLTTQAKTKLALNWKPEPEFGGFYEAETQGFFKKQGLEVEILEGGSSTPTTQMLTNGTVDYAIVSAEEIILNNDKDPTRKLIAVFTVFDKSPYMIMSHDNPKFKSLGDVFASETETISLQKGLPYVEYLIKKFSPVKAKLVPYTGGISVFETNPNLSQQGFITSEALIAQTKGLKTKNWLVADVGFNPYITVLAVKEDFLKKNAEQVNKMAKAVREGWLSYLKNPAATNKLMSAKNPSMSLELMNLSLEKMKELMNTNPKEIGKMQSSRWKTLQKQMFDLKLIKNESGFEKEQTQNF